MSDDPLIEVWHLDRKVSVYSDVVLRVWGYDMTHEMSEEPKTLDSVQDAFDWLYGQDRRAPDFR